MIPTTTTKNDEDDDDDDDNCSLSSQQSAINSKASTSTLTTRGVVGRSSNNPRLHNHNHNHNNNNSNKNSNTNSNNTNIHNKIPVYLSSASLYQSRDNSLTSNHTDNSNHYSNYNNAAVVQSLNSSNIETDPTTSYHARYANVPFVATPGLPMHTSLDALFHQLAHNNGDGDGVGHADGDYNTNDEIIPSTRSLTARSTNTSERPLHHPYWSCTRFYAISVLLSMLFTFQSGYSIGVMNSLRLSLDRGFQTTLDSFDWSFIVAMFCFGGLTGACIACYNHLQRPRKFVFLFNIILIIVGSVLQILNHSPELFMIGRFIVGFTSGISGVYVPLYIGEISPPDIRGTMGALNTIVFALGLVFSQFCAFILRNHINDWQILCGFTAIPALFQLLSWPWLLESPRAYLIEGRYRDATKTLRQIRGIREVYSEIASIINVTETESDTRWVQDMNRSSSDIIGDSCIAKGFRKISCICPLFFRIFNDPETRYAFLMAFFLQLVQQFSGINIILFYSTEFFRDNGFLSPTLATLAGTGMYCIILPFAMWFLKILGRKILLLISLYGMILSLIMVTSRLVVMDRDDEVVSLKFIYFSILCFISFYQMGMCHIPWLIFYEIFPAYSRASVLIYFQAAQWGFCSITVYFYPLLFSESFKTSAFVPSICILGLACPMVHVFFFETKNRTPLEIKNEILKRATSSRTGIIQTTIKGPATYGAIPGHFNDIVNES